MDMLPHRVFPFLHEHYSVTASCLSSAGACSLHRHADVPQTTDQWCASPGYSTAGKGSAAPHILNNVKDLHDNT